MSEIRGAISEELLLEQASFIRSLARLLVGGDDLADDLGQEAYVSALKHPPRDPAALRPWLGRVLRNRAHKEYRNQSRRERREQVAVRNAEARARDVPRPEELLAQKELMELVLTAVKELPEPIARTIHLRYYLDMSPTHIAAQESLSVDTVKSRLKRGLQLLRANLDQGQGGRREWSVALLPLAGLSSAVLPARTTGSLVSGILSMPTSIKIALVIATLLIGSVSLLDPFSGGMATSADISPVTPPPDKESPPVGALAKTTNQEKREPVKASYYARGVVRDKQGRPVQGVRLLLLHGKKLGEKSNLTTDAEGRYGIDLAGPEKLHVLMISPLFKTTQRPTGTLQSPNANLDFVVEPYATGVVEVRVRDTSSSKLLPTFAANATAMIRYGELGKAHPVLQSLLSYLKNRGVTTDRARTSVSPMPRVRGDASKGVLLLEVPLPDTTTRWPVLVKVGVSKNEGVQQWVRLKANDKTKVLLEVRSTKIQGRVLDTLGKPIVGALVYPGNQLLARGDEPFKPFDRKRVRGGVHSDKDGKFAFQSTTPVRQVTAWHQAYSVRTVPTKEASVIKLTGLCTIDGVLVNVLGQPQPMTEICLDRIHFQKTDAQGRFVFKNIEPGLRGLWVVKPGTAAQQLGKIRWAQGPWIVLAKTGITVSVRLDPNRHTFVDGWTGQPLLFEQDSLIPTVEIELRSMDKRVYTRVRGILWLFEKGGFAPRSFDTSTGLLTLDNIPAGRYSITTSSGWFVLEIKGPKAVLELGAADLTVTGKRGTRVRFYRTGSDRLVRVLSGRVPGSWNKIPRSGTLLIPYLRPGSYDICVGRNLEFHTRIQISGKGTRLMLD